MKVRAWNDPLTGDCRVMIPAPQNRLPKETDKQFLDRCWKHLKTIEPGLPKEFVDVEQDGLPSRVDKDGVPCRRCWRVDVAAGMVKHDNTVPNPHRVIHDKRQELKAILEKPQPTNADVLKLKRLEAEIAVEVEAIRGVR